MIPARTSTGLVTPLALIRAIRNVSASHLALQVGVDEKDILDWERGVSKPKTSTFKRLGLALRWPWVQLTFEPMSYEEAMDHLMKVKRKRAQVG